MTWGQFQALSLWCVHLKINQSKVGNFDPKPKSMAEQGLYNRWSVRAASFADTLPLMLDWSLSKAWITHSLLWAMTRMDQNNQWSKKVRNYASDAHYHFISKIQFWNTILIQSQGYLRSPILQTLRSGLHGPHRLCTIVVGPYSVGNTQFGNITWKQWKPSKSLPNLYRQLTVGLFRNFL